MSIFAKDSNLGPHEEEEEEGGGGVVTAVAIFKATLSTAVTNKRVVEVRDFVPCQEGLVVV